MKFEVGNKVKIVSPDCEGQVGIVRTTGRGSMFPIGVLLDKPRNDNSHDWNIENYDWCDDSKRFWAGDAHELELVEEEGMKFKVGDKVRIDCVADCNANQKEKVSEIITVRPQAKNLPYAVLDPNYPIPWYHTEECLSLVESDTPTLEDMPKGTIVVNTEGEQRKVLYVLEAGLYAMSSTQEVGFDIPAKQALWTMEMLRNHTFTIEDQEEEKTPLEIVTEFVKSRGVIPIDVNEALEELNKSNK